MVNFNFSKGIFWILTSLSVFEMEKYEVGVLGTGSSISILT